MKNKLSTLVAAATLALAVSAPALAGGVGLVRSYPAGQPNAVTIAELQKASATALCEGREGNKNNAAFVLKSNQDNGLIARLDSAQPVDQKEVDEALQPVQVW